MVSCQKKPKACTNIKYKQEHIKRDGLWNKQNRQLFPGESGKLVLCCYSLVNQGGGKSS